MDYFLKKLHNKETNSALVFKRISPFLAYVKPRVNDQITFERSLRYIILTGLYMKIILTVCWIIFLLQAKAQLIDSLNTAKNCSYMKKEEKEMIYEINQLRSNPGSYLIYIVPLLKEQETLVKNFGKGSRDYSLSFRTETDNDKQKTYIDTNWYYSNEEKLNALKTLVDDLKKLKPLRILQPDRGIYAAAQKHAKDEEDHQWTLLHTGSDGSEPWDRIKKFSPRMMSTGENIAGSYPKPTARDILIQLLIDEGIPGYGHRRNLLDPQWTHMACLTDGLQEGMYRWIQDFGEKN